MGVGFIPSSLPEFLALYPDTGPTQVQEETGHPRGTSTAGP